MQEALKLITVVSLKVEDAGLYTCLASSLAGEDGKNHWVRVQGDTSCSCVLVQYSPFPLTSSSTGIEGLMHKVL